MKKSECFVHFAASVLLTAVSVSACASAFLTTALFLPSSARAESTVTKSDDGDEYSFEWLDPDKKIYVLQNRKYTKANRVMLSLMGGLAKNSPYETSFSLDPRIAFYFSEQLGFEVFYTNFFNSPSTDYQALVSTNANVLPNVFKVKSQVGGLLHWVPWYAKINFFNSILYFDWYLSGGVGQVTGDVYTSGLGDKAPVAKSFTGYYLGTGHQFHLSQSVSVRLDFTNCWFNAPLRYTSGATQWFTNSTFEAGLGLRL